MGGGLMQLVAYGAQDVYISGNPQITLFKVVYRRHTNFSCETIEHVLSGNPTLGGTGSVTVARNGDLAKGVHLLLKVKALEGATGQKVAWVKRLGHAIINSVEVSIGGSKIDKQYGTWLDLWYELARAGDHDRGYDRLIGNVPELTTFNTTAKPAYTMHVPLQFWFCRNSGLALPLIALQYHEVTLKFEFAQAEDLVCHDGAYTTIPSATRPQIESASVLVDYVYLDAEERRRFAQVGHEYLIEQVQHPSDEPANNTTNKYRLGFNHPTKEIVWAMKNGNYNRGVFAAYASDNDFTSALGKELVKQMIRMGDGTGDSSHTAAIGAAGAVNVAAKKIAVDDSVLDGNEDAGEATSANVRYFSPHADGEGVSVTPASGNKSVATGTNLLDLIDAAIVNIVHDGSNANAIANYSVDVVSVVAPSLTAAVCSQPLDTWTLSSNVSFTSTTVNQPTNYGVYITGELNPTYEAMLQLNGHDRFAKRLGDWFNYAIPACGTHTNTPADGVNVYSFSLEPEKHQPKGSANLSRIDDAQLTVWFRKTTETSAFPSHLGVIDYVNENNRMYIFAFSYNVLRVMSGMAGLAYSS